MEKFEAGLYLVATPIGNLGDISFRAIELLKNADMIAAEDTRNTIKLLNHFDIKTKLTSYHEYTTQQKEQSLIEYIKDGNIVALVSDAGMPAISDPGYEIVKLAYDNDIKVSVIPGACALVSAIAISGINSRRFCFEGFLPSDKNEKKEILEELKFETRSIILYEAPHRINKTLIELSQVLGDDRKISIIKEITKKHESIIRGSIKEIIKYFEENKARGEFVLVIEGKDRIDESFMWKDKDIKEHLDMYIKMGIDKKSAMKMVAKDRSISKREVYEYVIR